MKPADVERLFAELTFERDVRRQPDDRRRVQFVLGWQDATVLATSYAGSTLKRLTWRNLGYRFGEHEGAQSIDAIDAVYRILERAYAPLWVARSNEDALL